MKKIALCLTLVAFFLFQTNALADGTLTQTLVTEEYDTNSHNIYRIYENAEQKQTYTDIFIPSELIKTIEASDQPLVEAKKQLAFYYVSNEMELEMKELNNQFYLNFSPQTVFSLSPNLKATFEQQQTAVQTFVQEKQTKGEKSSVKPSIPTYKELQTSIKDDQDTNMMVQKPLKIESPNDTKVEPNTSFPWLKWTGISIVIISLVLSIWWMIRRSSSQSE